MNTVLEAAVGLCFLCFPKAWSASCQELAGKQQNINVGWISSSCNLLWTSGAGARILLQEWDGGLQAAIPWRCEGFLLNASNADRVTALSGAFLTWGVLEAADSPQQLTMAECKHSLHTVSGKSISSWEPGALLWINWQYQPLCC